MSILRWKQKLSAQGGCPQSTSPSSGSSPTNTTVTNTNIPDYAQPYVMNMLQAAQSQVFNPDMTALNAYTPYSTNPQDYVAGFSPLQQQAQSSAANLQTPGQYGAATNATLGTMGAGLNLAGQEAQTGQNLAQASTNPNAVGAYMNPYIQNALAPAQQLLNQQYGMQGAAQQGQATSSGAFGGTRNALQQGLNQQNQMLAQNQLVGNAYQQAFGNAQNQMNQVSQQGLQGQQAAMQGLGQIGSQAGQLGTLGGQELAAQQGIIGTQAAQGAQEQTQQQNVINQAVQNYATAQQYPFMQLGTMSSLLRGLPMQQTSTSMYQAQPTAAQSGIGLLGAGAALAGATKKEGGIIGMKSGGEVPGFKYGTLINQAQLQNDAQGLSGQQLQKRIADPTVNPDERQLFQGVQADQNRLRQIPGAGQAIAQAGMPPPPNPQQMPMDARMSGIAQGGGGAFQGMSSPVRMAGGGILAFAGDGEEGSQVKEEPTDFKGKFLAEQGKYLQSRGVEPGIGTKSKSAMSALEEQQTAAPEKADFQKRLAIAQGFLDFAQTPATGRGLAGLLKPAAHAVGVGATGYAAATDAAEKAKLLNAQSQAALEESNRKAAEGDWSGATKAEEEHQKLENAKKIEEMRVASAAQVANIHASVAGAATKLEEKAVDAYMKDHPGSTFSEAYQAVKGAGRVESNDIAAIKTGLADAQGRLLLERDPEKRKSIQSEVDTYTKKLQSIAGVGPQVAPPAQQSSLIMDGHAFPDQKSLAAYKAAKQKQNG